MKIYIVGSVASGKTTLARRISRITGVPCHHLDEVVFEEDVSDSWGNRKRPAKERDRLFQKILAEESYIIEDAGRECFVTGMEEADTVILLEISGAVRKKRILFRWIKQNLGIEKCIYRPHIDMLKVMFRWAENYDTGADGTKGRVAGFCSKTIILRNNREINRYLGRLSENCMHVKKTNG